MSDPAVQVRKRGVVTLPAELREKYDIQKGDTFRLVDLDGVFVLTRMVSLVPELAQEIERLRLEAGLTTGRRSHPRSCSTGCESSASVTTLRPMPTTTRPRVFVDADVISAGSASPSDQGASLVTLRMGEITLIDAVTSRQAITEAERNLSAKLPHALTTFRLLVERSLRVVPNPSREDLAAHEDIADPKDLPARSSDPW